MLNQKLFFFIAMLLLNFDAKAFLMSAIPSSLSDTCVEINLKSGTRIMAKITKKTSEKVYFKKCDNLSDTTSYFVLQEKIDTIKTLDIAAKDIQKEKRAERIERIKKDENKAKQNRIWTLLGVSLLCILLVLVSTGLDGFGSIGFLLLGVSSIWGLIEVLTYKGQFEGKIAALAYFVGLNTLLFLFSLLLIIIILSFG